MFEKSTVTAVLVLIIHALEQYPQCPPLNPPSKTSSSPQRFNSYPFKKYLEQSALLMRTPGAAITDSVTQNAMIGEGGVVLNPLLKGLLILGLQFKGLNILGLYLKGLSKQAFVVNRPQQDIIPSLTSNVELQFFCHS